MATPPSYFLRQNDSETGPFTVAQINRMKQRDAIMAETPCRGQEETEFRRLDAVFPHFRSNQRADPAKIAEIKRNVAEAKIKWLTGAGFLGGALFWAPFGIVGIVAASTAMGAGNTLLFKHRRAIGLVLILLGIFGLAARFWRRFSA